MITPNGIWTAGLRRMQLSRLYLRALLRRGPSVFVALAWSQVFWLVLELVAGNEDSHGYVRLPSVAVYALALHVGGHVVLYRLHRRNASHHVLEFTLDLVTDVLGFAWINLAEEMLAQIFFVTAQTAVLYSVLALVASLGAMEIGSGVRGMFGCTTAFNETANQLDAGAFALPTSWLVTQAVHISLYGFFYRTSTAGGLLDQSKTGRPMDIHLAASLFLLVYALLCSTVATRFIGGTVSMASLNVQSDANIFRDGEIVTRPGDRSDRIMRAVEAGGPFTAAQASDAVGEEYTPSGHGPITPQATHCRLAPDSENTSDSRSGPIGDGPSRDPAGCSDEVGSCHAECDADSSGVSHSVGGTARETAAVLLAAAVGGTPAGVARKDALYRGMRTYGRLAVGLMVGWAYNLWGQVMFRQEELEFRFGPALGASVYASITTALGVCIMVRGADRLDSIGGEGRETMSIDATLSMGYGEGRRQREQEEIRRMNALQDYHARRMLVVVGGISLMVGWAWEEAFDLMLDAALGDKANAGMVTAKLGLAAASTTIVLWAELMASHHPSRVDAGEAGKHDHGGETERSVQSEPPVDVDLLQPLMATADDLGQRDKF